jgi:putative SbcD/Mre11-related phosphoesterase
MAVRPAAAADLQFSDRAVYLADADALVLADLHVGRESSSQVAAPISDADDLIGRLNALLATYEPATAVFAGDILHSFGHLPVPARQTVEELWNTCESAGIDAIAVAGNHDDRLSDCWPGGVEAETELSDGTIVCHGHEPPERRGDRYIIGHDHPALGIEGVRRPCYLFGEKAFRGGDLLVLPAFTRLAGGVECNSRTASDLQSPLVGDLGAMQPVVWDGDGEASLWFPPLGSIRQQL